MSEIAPIFLLGAGRSGTTLLCKILCMHPEAAFVSYVDTRRIPHSLARALLYMTSRFPKLRRAAWFTRGGQAYTPQRRLLLRAIPAPTEGELLYASCGLSTDEHLEAAGGVARDFLRRTFSSIQARHRAKVIFLKRTANNRRIPYLDSAFPEAKYVVLWREGLAVTASLLSVDWWPDHEIWWANRRSPRELGRDRHEMAALAARNWVEEVKAIARGLRNIASSRILHVRFEDLLADPQRTVSRILRFCELSTPAAYLDEIRRLGLRPAGERWRSTLSESEIAVAEQTIAQSSIAVGYTLQESNRERLDPKEA